MVDAVSQQKPTKVSYNLNWCSIKNVSIYFLYYYRYDATDLLIDLRRDLSGKFENFCRMSAVDFEYLLNGIAAQISKTDTNMRKSIPAQERLAVTLRFLATGDSYQSLSFLFKISPQLISTIIPEVSSALIDLLKIRTKVSNASIEF